MHMPRKQKMNNGTGGIQRILQDPGTLLQYKMCTVFSVEKAINKNYQ